VVDIRDSRIARGAHCRRDGVGVDMAGVGRCSASVRAGRRSVRSGTASWRRHRREHGRDRPGTCRRHCVLRGNGPWERPYGDDPDRRRLRRHPDPSRRAWRCEGRRGGGRCSDRDGGVERGGRTPLDLRSPRGSDGDGGGRLPRSPHVPPGACRAHRFGRARARAAAGAGRASRSRHVQPGSQPAAWRSCEPGRRGHGSRAFQCRGPRTFHRNASRARRAAGGGPCARAGACADARAGPRTGFGTPSAPGADSIPDRVRRSSPTAPLRGGARAGDDHEVNGWDGAPPPGACPHGAAGCRGGRSGSRESRAAPCRGSAADPGPTSLRALRDAYGCAGGRDRLAADPVAGGRRASGERRRHPDPVEAARVQA
jgi:hypothetical protein